MSTERIIGLAVALIVLCVVVWFLVQLLGAA